MTASDGTTSTSQNITVTIENSTSQDYSFILQKFPNNIALLSDVIITNVDNIIYTNKKYANIFNLITADGGINILHNCLLLDLKLDKLVSSSFIDFFLEDCISSFLTKIYLFSWSCPIGICK